MATFEQGQINASKLTEKEMAVQWQKAVDSYNKAIADINSDIEKMYNRMPDFTDVEKQEGAMRLWAEKNDRLNKLKASIVQSFNTSAQRAGRHIATSSELAINNTYYREQYTLSFFSEGDLPFTFVDPNVIESSVYGTEEAWAKIKQDIYGNRNQYITQTNTLTDLLRRDRNQTLRELQQTITSGLTRGIGADAMTTEIMNVIGTDPKPGQPGYTGLKAKSARIARTEGIRNLNAGYAASQNEAASLGIEQRKRWVATLDTRTRDTHVNADGKEVELNELFTVNGSQGPFPGQMDAVGENML
jgi:hypothetical protein